MLILLGKNGFIGKNLTKKLIKNKIDHLSPQRDELDLLCRKSIRTYFKQFKPKVIINLAGTVGGIGFIMKNPATIFSDNCYINLNLYNEILYYKEIYMVNLCSINVYPESLDSPYSEDDVFKGDPDKDVGSYGISKKIQLYLGEYYKKQYGIKTLNLICDNVYGPYDNFDSKNARVIPANIKKFINAKYSKSEYVSCWGTGQSIKSFLYIEDLVEILLKLTERKIEDNINIGSKELITIKELITKIANLTKYSGEIRWDKTKPEGANKRYLDISKLETKYKIKPKYSLDYGLNQIYKHYLSITK